MSKQYQVDNSPQANNSQRLLIGVPLVITLVFCFGFVAMNPNKSSTAISASTKDDKSTEIKPVALPPLPTSVATAQTLEIEATPSASASTDSAPTSSTPASNTGATPQPTPSASSAKTTSPQTSASRGTTITSKMHITVSNSIKKALGR